MVLRLGIDVGSTHTDAVILDEKNNVISAIKTETSTDITNGVINATKRIVNISGVDPSEIKSAMFGTTHCANAIVERRNLAKTALIRIGRPGSEAIEPLMEWPMELKNAIGDSKYMIQGGHEYNGEEIAPLIEDEVKSIVKEIRDKKVETIAVSSIFSPVNSSHEKRVAEILKEGLGPNFPITLSNEIGSIGLLERENSATLNAAVVKIANKAIAAFEEGMREAEIEDASLYLTQNDGTLMSADFARKYPILTIASGPTNSIRGAASLIDQSDCIVVDIGGTTTLTGILVKGFPRESALAVEIGGVRTNFRMPDLIATGCGGGTVVKSLGEQVEIGPRSVGYKLMEEGLAWGGETLTTTDVALAAGYAHIDDPRCDPSRLKDLDKNLILKTINKIVEKLEESIDKIKTDPEPLPVILVGGGGLLIPPDLYEKIKGASTIIRPNNYQFANAIGAAMGRVSGEVDKVYSIDNSNRENVIKSAKKEAVERAINAGADPETVQVVEIDEIALPYLPGSAIRIRVKAVGKLLMA